MTLDGKSKIGLAIIVAILVITTPFLAFSYLNQIPSQNEEDDTDDPLNTDPMDPPTVPDPVESPKQIIADGLVNITLFDNTGIMIEWNYTRIYIDPDGIPSNYSKYPADLILITHHHTHHYNVLDIRKIERNDTFFAIPAYMTDKVERHDALAVEPGDTFEFEGISITVFPSYLPDYPYGGQSFHPKDANHTSYIIDINGFTIFHGGSAKYMEEFEQLTGTIDVAILSIFFDRGFGDLNVSLQSTADAIELMRPNYCIPTHWELGEKDVFIQEFIPQLEDDCEVVDIGYLGFNVFSMVG